MFDFEQSLFVGRGSQDYRRDYLEPVEKIKLCKMKNIAVVGLGLLGCYSVLEACESQILAQKKLGSDLKLKLIDFDRVDIKNLPSQIFYSKKDLGSYKAEAGQAFINCRFPELASRIMISTARLTSTNISKHLYNQDIILDCTDNFEIRKLLDQFCFEASKAWIYAGLGFGRGVVADFDYTHRLSKSPRFANLFELLAYPKNHSGGSPEARLTAKLQIDKLQSLAKGQPENTIKYLDIQSKSSQEFKLNAYTKSKK